MKPFQLFRTLTSEQRQHEKVHISEIWPTMPRSTIEHSFAYTDTWPVYASIDWLSSLTVPKSHVGAVTPPGAWRNVCDWRTFLTIPTMYILCNWIIAEGHHETTRMILLARSNELSARLSLAAPCFRLAPPLTVDATGRALESSMLVSLWQQ